jgi:hypothetical protein
VVLRFFHRYATILLYFTDLGENDGGETVFTEAWPDDVAIESRKDIATVSLPYFMKTVLIFQRYSHVARFLLFGLARREESFAILHKGRC